MRYLDIDTIKEVDAAQWRGMGSNADIQAVVPAIHLVWSNRGHKLSVQLGYDIPLVPLTHWVVVAEGSVIGVVNPVEFARRYEPLP